MSADPRRGEAPLSVLLVHDRFAPDFAGGGEYVVLEIARHLQGSGQRVRVVTTGDPDLTEYAGISTTRLPLPRARLNLAWRAVAREARGCDIIHAFTYNGLYPAYRAGRALKIPVVCGVLALFGDAWLEMRGLGTGHLMRFAERRMLRLPFAARLFLSDFSRDFAAELGLAGPDDRVIEPGISLADYHASPDKGYVMFSGKLTGRKGVDAVLEVARALPHIPFQLSVWGDGLAELRARAPENITIAPFHDRLHLARQLAAARIFLFPTKAETFGLIVAEAMASGCAVVSSSPLPFAGSRVTQDDVPGMVEAVRGLWEDEVRCRALGAENRERAQRYDWTTHVEQLLAEYRNVLTRKGA